MKHHYKDESGAALIELALVTPLLLFIMLGAFELGRLAYFAIEVQNAARAGASYGGINIGNASSSDTVTQAAKNDAPDLPGLTATPGYACVCETLDLTSGTPSFSPSSGTVSCTDESITECTGASSTVSKNVISYITVSTQATITPVFSLTSWPLPGSKSTLPSSYTLHGYASMRILPN